MAYNKKQFYQQMSSSIDDLKQQGLYKEERVITSSQAKNITTDCGVFLNLCANNYLGLANNDKIINSAITILENGLYGMASVRFICGTNSCHIKLEKQLSSFLQTEDCILYSSCFDANTGLFETLLTCDDAIISDELNHASIIDGVRLCKAKRYRYQNNNMQDLEKQLKQARADNAKHILIATDGVFSMDGTIANLSEVCNLAKKYQALTMVDDSHAVGILGKNGKGSIEYCNVMGQIDIITGTLGKALGGASGGYTCGEKEVIEILRQKSRPYLFSNTLAPSLTNASITALEIIESGFEMREKLDLNASYFREKMTSAGFELMGGNHPIIPVLIKDAKLSSKFSEELLKLGVYVISFSYPVVPMDKARIRTQMNADFSTQELDSIINAFITVGKKLKVLK